MNVYIAKGGEGMGKTSVRPADEIERILRQYGDALYRLCLAMLGGSHDAEDAVQETLIRFFRKAPVFRGAEHEKAWLIRTAIRICIDESRRASRRTSVPLNEEIASAYSQESFELLETIRTLPEKDRDAVYLFYYEEYSTKDVARILGEREGTTRSRLSRARKKLRTMMEGEADGQIL